MRYFINTGLATLLLDCARLKYVPYRNKFRTRVYKLRLVENYFDGLSMKTRLTEKGLKVVDALGKFKPDVLKHCSKCQYRVECLVVTECRRSLMAIEI